jgi:hypothetical protein
MGGGDASPAPCRYLVTRWVSFVWGNPINFNDPSGHDPRPGQKGDYKQLGPDLIAPPPSLSGVKIGGTTKTEGEWNLVTNGDGKITWYEIINYSGYNHPSQLSEQEQKAARMQGSVILDGVSWSWTNDGWITSKGNNCAYSNSVHCVYPYEATKGNAPTAAVSPKGNISANSSTYIYIEVNPSRPGDRVFAGGGRIFNAYDGCPACVPDKGVDLLSINASLHYGYNGKHGASASVFIWLWFPVPNTVIHYGDRY